MASFLSALGASSLRTVKILFIQQVSLKVKMGLILTASEVISDILFSQRQNRLGTGAHGAVALNKLHGTLHTRFEHEYLASVNHDSQI